MTASSFDEEDDMTLTDGPGLRPLLAAAVADGPGPTDLLSGVRRAQRRRRVLFPAVAAGVAATAVVAFVSIGGAPSAAATVSAAAAHTGGQSFRVHITAQDRTYDGAFDPARRTGRLASPVGEDRYIGDTVYTRNTKPKGVVLPSGKRWISMRRTSAAELGKMGTIIEVIKVGPQDPQFVLQRLRTATRVRETGSASGNGWTGHRYSFTINDRSDAKGLALSASGTVAVDSRGLVRVLSLHAVEPGQKGGGSDSVIEFGDYGVRVEVTPPPAAEVIAFDRLNLPRLKANAPSRKPAEAGSAKPGAFPTARP
jgi:hypothetical protein